MRDFGISIKIISIFGILKLLQWRKNVNFSNGNLGFEKKINGISLCINIIYHGLLLKKVMLHLKKK